MTNSYLIVADVDHIQRYIFSSSQLRAVRGGSLLVEQLGDRFSRLGANAPNWRCLRSQGGQMVGILTTDTPEEAGDYCRRIEREAMEIGGGALTAATAFEPYTTSFNTTLKKAFAQIETKKRSIGNPDQPGILPSGGFARYCDLCRSAPAVKIGERFVHAFGTEGEDERHLCQSCYQRVKTAHVKAQAGSDFALQIVQSIDPELRLPDSMDELWGAEQEGRFMAMLAADGNGIGQLIGELDSPDLYEQFAQALGECFRTSLAEAGRPLWAHRIKKTHVLPLMPIIAGGDDIAVLLPAEHSTDFALRWAQVFARLTQENEAIQQGIQAFKTGVPQMGKQRFPGEGPWPLTLSIGIAIAKPQFPLMAYHRLAGDLDKSAKRAVNAPGKTTSAGAVDFAFVTTAAAERLSALRNRYEVAGNPSCTLTARPYLLEPFGKLLELAEVLGNESHGVPRNLRKYLYTELWNGPEAAKLALKFVLSRCEKKTAEQIKKLLAELTGSPGSALPLFTIDSRTPLADALELADLTA